MKTPQYCIIDIFSKIIQINSRIGAAGFKDIPAKIIYKNPNKGVTNLQKQYMNFHSVWNTKKEKINQHGKIITIIMAQLDMVCLIAK